MELEGNRVVESLEEMKSRHPKEWARVFKKVEPLIRENRVAEMNQLAQEYSHSKAKSKIFKALFDAYSDAVLSRNLEGKIQLPRREAWILQRLFFKYELQRKAVSPLGFKLCWPFIREKGIFLSLVASKGIYCFYSKSLLRYLEKVINHRPCIEVAAGDGTLSLLLQERGVAIQATDNYSWAKQIRFPSWVQKISADDALQQMNPEVVVSCWPPPGNHFERKIFETPSVQTYIVLGSRSPGATGNELTYKQVKNFSRREAEEMSKAVYPPEVLPVVYIFERTSLH